MYNLMLANHTLDSGEGLDKLTFPKVVLPKYDGIRVHCYEGKAYARSGKLIPNKFLQSALADYPSGLEGEVVVNDSFADTTSALRSHEVANYRFKYYLFDDVSMGHLPFMQRLSKVYAYTTHDAATSHEVFNLEQLLEWESYYHSLGYEGIIIRCPNAKYKHGRATFREQSYLSFKRFATDQARIVGFKPKIEAGEVVDTMGALELRCRRDIFWCGSGLDDITRGYLWSIRNTLRGRCVEFKYQKSTQNSPRFPVFLRLL